LKPFVNFKPICPEFEIGLGIPRDPIKIIKKNNKKYLIQPAKNMDISEDMNKFFKKYITKLDSIDGFILKSKSPSCGIKDVKIYPTIEKSAPIERSSGFFGGEIINFFKNLAVEDELRLQNSVLREHFLRKIFTLARFRTIKNSNTINPLINFHTKNKFLLLSYNQKEQKILGKIIANQKNELIEEIYNNYQTHLFQTFSRAARCSSNINVLQHAYGYMKKNLNLNEKKVLFNSINSFKEGRVSINVPIAIIKSWINRFDEDYLKNQTYFNPYPEELMRVESVDVCSTRDYFK
jgi:uncharacterized protein YbgA (DUF1722 family)/uncharacterized protein YbbK (DUF523 family)